MGVPEYPQEVDQRPLPVQVHRNENLGQPGLLSSVRPSPTIHESQSSRYGSPERGGSQQAQATRKEVNRGSSMNILDISSSMPGQRIQQPFRFGAT